jgi:hypothetical protein
MWHPSLGYLAIAVALVAGCVAFLLMSPPSLTDAAEDAAKSAAVSASTSRAMPTWPPPTPIVAQNQSPRMPEGDADPTRDLSSYVLRGQKPTTAQVIERLHQAGDYTGIGAFPLPGTRPPLVGLAVPEDFVLPDGYVRHHQATDDGQRIEAILMFAPDHQFFDAAKQPIAVPANRVVPPELAPPGLPIRQIVIPRPIEPESVGR